MQRERSITDCFVKALVLAAALLILLFIFGRGDSKALDGRDHFVSVRIEGRVQIDPRNVEKYFKVLPDEMEDLKVPEDTKTLQLGEGKGIKVKIKGALDSFRFAEPVTGVMSAPVYLGKTVSVDTLLGGDLRGTQGMICAGKGGLRLRLKKDRRIEVIDGDACSSAQSVSFIFDNPVIAETKKTIGVKPFVRRSIKVPDKWVSEGEDVRITIPMPDYDEKESQLAIGFWTDHPNSDLEEDAYLADITGIEQEKVGNQIYSVKAKLPLLSKLKDVTPPWYCPYPPEIKMTVTAKLNNADIVTERFSIHVSRRGWGIVGSTLFLVIVLLFIMHINKTWSPFKKETPSDEEYKKEYKSRWLKRFFFSPLDFSITPNGTYSISKSQALFWTFLVGFACVYVYVLQGEFIMIPEQILLLLGITGGTALTSRINAVNKDVRVPKKIEEDVKEEVQNAGRIPRLRDMVTIGGKLNVYKFQMVVFTGITGAIVFLELLRSFNFPEIPGTLIALMGVSNTLYLGNEISIDPKKKVREVVDAFEKETDPAKKEALAKEIEEALKACYQIEEKK